MRRTINEPPGRRPVLPARLTTTVGAKIEKASADSESMTSLQVRTEGVQRLISNEP
jgi:hypothetical protein